MVFIADSYSDFKINMESSINFVFITYTNNLLYIPTSVSPAEGTIPVHHGEKFDGRISFKQYVTYLLLFFECKYKQQIGKILHGMSNKCWPECY